MTTSVPASFEEYAVDRPDARFTDWLRERSEPAWSEATGHPFTRELGYGSLPASAFAEYLVQDYAFVEALVGTFGFAVGQAPGMEVKRPLVEFLDTVTDEENDYFQRAFDALDVPESRRREPEPSETTAAFVDLLGRAAREGGYEETLAVLVPAEWIYEEWATAVAPATGPTGATGDSDSASHGDSPGDGDSAGHSNSPGDGDSAGHSNSPGDGDSVADGENEPTPGSDVELPFYYAEWIDLHAMPAFVEFVEWLRGELDRHGPALSPRREARVAALFERTVDLEVAFFDDAYEDVSERGAGGS